MRVVMKRCLATKSIDALVAQSENAELHRTLSVWDLTAVGVGEIIGTGRWEEEEEGAGRGQRAGLCSPACWSSRQVSSC